MLDFKQDQLLQCAAFLALSKRLFEIRVKKERYFPMKKILPIILIFAGFLAFMAFAFMYPLPEVRFTWALLLFLFLGFTGSGIVLLIVNKKYKV